MKRYVIPILFFAIGVTLQFFFYFSWVSFTLLSISTLLLGLFLYSLDFQTKESIETQIQNQNKSDSVLFVLDEIPLKDNAENRVVPKENIFAEESPIMLAKSIRSKEDRIQFLESIKPLVLDLQNTKISSVLYAYFDGIHFTESLWQKGSVLIESEPNPIEWEIWEEDRIKECLPLVSKNKLYIPISINQHLFGCFCLYTKESWKDSDIQNYWEKATVLAESLFTQKEYSKVTKVFETGLLNQSFFYNITKTKFDSKEKENLLLIKFINTEYLKEISICLDHYGKKLGYLGLGLFQLESDLFAALIPNQFADEFSNFLQQFVEELDAMGFPSEIAIGFANKANQNTKFDIWIKSAYQSLEENIQYNAA
ncbi:hypothetical protein P3G55_10915 [Leptospira sp. 96542]|nr:hypothetical protein [Leptospira sp. 96542]